MICIEPVANCCPECGYVMYPGRWWKLRAASRCLFWIICYHCGWRGYARYWREV